MGRAGGAFQAILEHNGLANLTSFTDDQKMLIYKDYKKLIEEFGHSSSDDDETPPEKEG